MSSAALTRVFFSQGGKIPSLRDPSYCKFRAHREAITGLIAWQQESKAFATASRDGSVKVWSPQDDESIACIHTLIGHTASIHAICGNSALVATGSADATARIICNGDFKAAVSHAGAIYALTLLPNCLATGSEDRSAIVWDLITTQARVILQHQDSVTALHPTERGLLTSSENVVHLWDLRIPTHVALLEGHQGVVEAIGGTHEIFTGSADATVKMWDMRMRRSVQTFAGHAESITTLDTHAGNLVTGSLDRSMRLWNMATGACEKTFLFCRPVQTVHAGLDASNLFAGLEDGSLCFFDPLKIGRA